MIVPDDDARFNALRTHTAHHEHSASDISIPQLNIIQSTLPDVQVVQIVPTSLTTLFFNLDKEPWSDDRVRKAIFPEEPPPATVVEIKELLPSPETLLEIQITASRDLPTNLISNPS